MNALIITFLEKKRNKNNKIDRKSMQKIGTKNKAKRVFSKEGFLRQKNWKNWLNEE